jgi:hypothetical protein
VLDMLLHLLTVGGPDQGPPETHILEF